MPKKPTYKELEQRIQVLEKAEFVSKQLKERLHKIEREQSERKQIEKALSQSETYLRNLIFSIPDLIWLKDENGKYLFCNSKFERFFGAKKKEIVGKTDYDFVDRELADFFRQHDQIAISKGRPSTNEEEIIYADDGHTEIIETIKSPMFGSDGQFVGVLGIARDITERKQAEEERKRLEIQLHQAQKMEAIGTLAGGVAHDINNILAGIVGNAQLAELQMGDPIKVKKNINHIVEGSLNAAALIRQILTYKRQSEYKKRPLNVFVLLKETLKLLRSTMPSNIKIRENIFSKAKIMADSAQTQQVIMNLCTNAYRAMSDTGGTLTVGLQEIEEEEPPFFSDV